MKDSPGEGALSVLSLVPAHLTQRWPGVGLTSCIALQALLRVLQDLIFQTKLGIKLHQNAIQVFSCLEQASNMGNVFSPVLCYRKPQIIFGFGADSNVTLKNQEKKEDRIENFINLIGKTSV